METARVLERIDAILVSEFELDKDQLTDDAHLIDDLNLDSLDAMDLIALLEQEFSIGLDEKELVQLRTVGEMRQYVAGVCKVEMARASEA
ncbi:MAG: hypothetical protein KTR31_01665 [Myxococcales bacterium]|nr:hypothetical protein [Myxococcales bacterium]